jgi:hypothetical protein
MAMSRSGNLNKLKNLKRIGKLSFEMIHFTQGKSSSSIPMPFPRGPLFIRHTEKVEIRARTIDFDAEKQRQGYL